MANYEITQPPSDQRLVASARRFFRWLTSAKVVLSLIMLVLMFYMVIIPLYKMVETTFTFQPKDIFRVPDAQVGSLTFFHYLRMLNSQMSKYYLYNPLVHPHRHVWQEAHQPTGPDAVYHAGLDDRPSLDGAF
jgi:hypothetical protein